MTDKNMMTLAEVNRQLNAKKRNKYNAVRCQIDGITFDSRKEARYYVGLKSDKRTGEIVGFDCQVPFHFILFPHQNEASRQIGCQIGCK